MKKPTNYDETQVSGDYIPVELGGHILIIKSVEETQSKTGREMIKIMFDFAETDKQPGHFMSQFKNDIRPDKKWPHQATHYMLTKDAEGNCSRAFKAFTTSVERSNDGFKIAWGDAFCKCLKDKLVGGVFGMVEQEYQGEVKKRRELRWFRSVDGVLEADIPEDKLLADKPSTPPSHPVGSDGFMNIPEGIDEELPFN